jgi:hypothetical protein
MDARTLISEPKCRVLSIRTRKEENRTYSSRQETGSQTILDKMMYQIAHGCDIKGRNYATMPVTSLYGTYCLDEPKPM